MRMRDETDRRTHIAGPAGNTRAQGSIPDYPPRVIAVRIATPKE